MRLFSVAAQRRDLLAQLKIAVMDAQGQLHMECLLETKASTVVEFIQGLQGTRSLTFEEGTWAAWTVKQLRQIPSIGSIRAALLVAWLQTPHRFRTKRQLWAYSGFAVQWAGSRERIFTPVEAEVFS